MSSTAHPESKPEVDKNWSLNPPRFSLMWFALIPLMAIRRIRAALRLPDYTVITSFTYISNDENWKSIKGDAGFETLLNDLNIHSSMLQHWINAYNLYQAACQTRSVPGSIAELGVYKGGTAKLLSHVLADTGKTLHLFDTFSGIPPTVDQSLDKVSEGDFASPNEETVLALVGDSLPVTSHAGFFPETAKGMENERFSFVHLDADIYESTVNGISWFYPRVNIGGAIVVHDYASPACPGVAKAIDDYFADKPERVFRLPAYQALIVKLND